MPDFLELANEEKNSILEQAAQQLGRPARVLEKDLWVCWVLARLFGQDFGAPLTFKGGTSLAKVFKVIQRFSEDVDVTVDHRPWNINLGREISKSKRKENSELVLQRLIEYVQVSLLPPLQCHEMGVESTLEVSGSDVKIYVSYPSVLEPDKGSSYLRECLFKHTGAIFLNIQGISPIRMPSLENPAAKG